MGEKVYCKQFEVPDSLQLFTRQWGAMQNNEQGSDVTLSLAVINLLAVQGKDQREKTGGQARWKYLLDVSPERAGEKEGQQQGRDIQKR